MRIGLSEFVDWKSAYPFVIPAQSLPRTRTRAGIQVLTVQYD